MGSFGNCQRWSRLCFLLGLPIWFLKLSQYRRASCEASLLSRPFVIRVALNLHNISNSLLFFAVSVSLALPLPRVHGRLHIHHLIGYGLDLIVIACEHVHCPISLLLFFLVQGICSGELGALAHIDNGAVPQPLFGRPLRASRVAPLLPRVSPQITCQQWFQCHDKFRIKGHVWTP